MKQEIKGALGRLAALALTLHAGACGPEAAPDRGDRGDGTTVPGLTCDEICVGEPCVQFEGDPACDAVQQPGDRCHCGDDRSAALTCDDYCAPAACLGVANEGELACEYELEHWAHTPPSDLCWCEGFSA